MQFVKLFRNNPHILNYGVIISASIIPVLLYANSRSPSQASIETALVSIFIGYNILHYVSDIEYVHAYVIAKTKYERLINS